MRGGAGEVEGKGTSKSVNQNFTLLRKWDDGKIHIL